MIPSLMGALWVISFFVCLFALSQIVRPHRKRSTALLSDFTLWIRMPSSYQVLMVATAAFFSGALILYPAAVFFHESIKTGNGWKAFFEILFFLVILSISVFYAWKKGNLKN